LLVFSHQNQIKLPLKQPYLRHVLEIVQENQISGFFEEICLEVYNQMREIAEDKVALEVILFDFDGKILAKHSQ